MTQFNAAGPLIFDEADENIRSQVVDPVVDSLLLKRVRLDRLKVFYVKWIYDNQDANALEYAKIKMPIKDWLPSDKLRTLRDHEWDKSKSVEQNRSEALWKLMWEQRAVHQLNLKEQDEKMPKLAAIISDPTDVTWRDLLKRKNASPVWKEDAVYRAYITDLDNIFGLIDEPDKEIKEPPLKRQKLM